MKKKLEIVERSSGFWIVSPLGAEDGPFSTWRKAVRRMEQMNLGKVLSRDGNEIGYLTGGSYPCGMESCTGNRVGVRWQDGTITFPCTKGLNWLDQDTAQII